MEEVVAELASLRQQLADLEKSFGKSSLGNRLAESQETESSARTSSLVTEELQRIVSANAEATIAVDDDGNIVLETPELPTFLVMLPANS